MISVLAAIVLAQPVVFPGGKSADLAQSLGSESKLPTLICDLGGKDIPQFTYQLTDLNELTKQIKAQSGLVYAPGTDMVFSSGTLSRHLFRIRPLAGTQVVWFQASPDGLRIENGKVSYRTKPGNALTAAELRNAPFSKPVKVHWLGDSAPIVGSLDGLVETEFLRLAAKAMGLRLVNGAKQFDLVANAKEIRRRVLASITAYADAKTMAALPKRQAAKITHLEWAMRLATDEHLETAYATQGSSVAIALNQADKQKIFRDMTNWNDAGTGGAQGLRPPGPSGQKPQEESTLIESNSRVRRRNYEALRDSIDFNQPVYLVLFATGDTQLEGAMRGRDGNPRPIRF